MTEQTSAVILAQHRDETKEQVIYQLYIPADIIYFKGHFNELPLLPGVTQIHWACELAQALLGQFQTSHIDKLKFMAPILPNTNVQLTLQKKADRLQFEYRQGDTINSKGLIHYAIPSV